jgi:Carboxypeptidase regulatory-like domain
MFLRIHSRLLCEAWSSDARALSGALILLVCGGLAWPAGVAAGQGVTTSSLAGVVKDSTGGVAPGATVLAVHQPSGTTYEAVTQSDGHFFMPGMRVGGPYRVTASLSGFSPDVRNDITLSLGVGQDLEFSLKPAGVAETVTVVGQIDPIFSSLRTGAATAVTREDLANLPTISGRITDITRLTPQYGGSGTIAGQDNRSSNITVDGSYFNGTFGLDTGTGGPGDRSGVAPISLEAIEQIQVSVAPYDVRQGNFTGANINSVTRSGANQFTGAVYTRYRNQSYVGTEAAGQPFNPGTFKTTNTGEWAGGPIVKNKLFFFQSFENQNDTRPLTTFTSNPGGAPIAGNTTRVLASDLAGLSSFLKQNFNYDPGPFDNVPKLTPAKPWMIKGNYNINNANKVTFRYNQLNSSTDVNQNGSGALGTVRQTLTTNFLTFANSNYSILENIKSGVGEWTSAFGSFTNDLIVGHTFNDESREQINLFPFVVIGDGAGSAYTAFGSEPFTPYNLLTYKQFQLQDSVTKVVKNHSWTFGGAFEKFHSDNSFYFGIQSAYSYASLADFYADANGFLANPNRTVSPVSLLNFQVKYLLQPGQTVPPLQPLDVAYATAYGQDEWRPRPNVTVTAGLRVDVPRFGNTAFDNPFADALTFRDQDGSPVKYSTGSLPSTTAYWSPRMGFNWDAFSNGTTQVRGGTGLFTGKPPFVWISNQIGNTGVLYGFLSSGASTAFPFNPNPDKYKPAATGGAASSYELDFTDPSFRFPQTWRTNIGADRKLPLGLIGTVDFIYNRDRNSPVYINANLPPAESSYTGVDNRPRWVATTAFPACATSGGPFGTGGQAGPCATRLNNAVGNSVTAAYVIKNASQNRSWDIAGSVAKTMSHGLAFKGGYHYGVSKSLVEPSSTAGSSWGSNNPITFDPNNPALAYSQNSPGKRVFLQASYSRQYLSFGSTTFSLFYEAHPNWLPVPGTSSGQTSANTSYIFSGDANGDGASGNDLIYIPRGISEMNFKPLTASGRTYSAAEQAAAFEQYIENDSYLSTHRGQYAQRGAVFYPMVNRVDLSIVQDLFHSVRGFKHSGQLRLDITNFGNLLNHNWGVGRRIINAQILTSPSVDANGALTYNLQTLSGSLLTTPLQTSASINDVYGLMLSFRYTFN